MKLRQIILIGMVFGTLFVSSRSVRADEARLTGLNTSLGSSAISGHVNTTVSSQAPTQRQSFVNWWMHHFYAWFQSHPQR